jgi:hypothetical protein
MESFNYIKMNKDLKDKAIQIKGKNYVQVKDRILALAEDEKPYSIETDYEYFSERKMWVVKAKLSYNGQVYTGLAQEIESDDYKQVNHSSALENAETSAVGRACAMAGIGVLDSIASVDEINKANNRPQTNYTPQATQDFEAQGLIQFNPPYMANKEDFGKLVAFLKQNGGKFDGEDKCWWVSQELASKLEAKLNPSL